MFATFTALISSMALANSPTVDLTGEWQGQCGEEAIRLSIATDSGPHFGSTGKYSASVLRRHKEPFEHDGFDRVEIRFGRDTTSPNSEIWNVNVSGPGGKPFGLPQPSIWATFPEAVGVYEIAEDRIRLSTFKPIWNNVDKVTALTAAYGLRCTGLSFTRVSGLAPLNSIQNRWTPRKTLVDNTIVYAFGGVLFPSNLDATDHEFILSLEDVTAAFALMAEDYSSSIENCKNCDDLEHRRAVYRALRLLANLDNPTAGGKGVGPSLIEQRPGEMATAVDLLDDALSVFQRLSVGHVDFSEKRKLDDWIRGSLVSFCAPHEVSQLPTMPPICAVGQSEKIVDAIGRFHMIAVGECVPHLNKHPRQPAGVSLASAQETLAWRKCMMRKSVLFRIQKTSELRALAGHFSKFVIRS
jgi:hypothetical protein